MKRPTLIASGSLNRMLQDAEVAWQRKDFQECIETMERASRLAPSNAEILLRLGRMHGLRYDYAAAEGCFEQALRVSPRKTEMLTTIADHCHNFRNQNLAERYLRRAVDEPDATPLACLKLAELYEHLRRVPEAVEMVERTAKLNPAFPMALLLQARLERLAGRVESAEQLLRSLITQHNPDTWTQAMAYYELGNILDRQGKYDDAMMAFLEAKSQMRAQAARAFGAPRNIHAGIKTMAANISAELLRRWSDNGPALAPPRRLALLCGYARSGTTLLEQVLDAHPEIVSAEETEVFIDDAAPHVKLHFPLDTQILRVLEAADAPALQRARAGYCRAMDLCIGNPIAGRLLLDKNPLFTFLIPAFIRIFPETKFLIAMRDPRDVVLSRFFQALPLTPLTANFLTLESTVEDYVINMRLWRTLAPLMPAPFLEIRYEDVVEDLEAAARKTLEFLGVPWDDRVLGFDTHAKNKLIRTNYADVTQPVYKRAVGRWRNYQKYLEPHMEKLEPFAKAFGYE